jgi:hypothetical protein
MESDIIYLRSDSHIITTKRIHLALYPYFNKIWSITPDAGFSKEEPITVNFDKRSVKHFIEAARSGDLYTYPQTEQWVFDKLAEDKVDLEFTKLFVGDILFYSTRETLTKSPFFYNCLEKFDGSLPENIDRCGHSFKYILRHLRNPSYIIPSQCNHDAVFFGLSDILPENSIISEHCSASINNTIAAKK